MPNGFLISARYENCSKSKSRDVISNDLEWFIEIFNDTKHRAVGSTRGLSATAKLLVLL